MPVRGTARKQQPGSPPPAPSAVVRSNGNAEMREQTTGADRTAPYIKERDFADIYYSSHTVTVGAVLFSVLWLIARWGEASQQSNVKLGLCAVAWTFVVFGVIHLPDGLMVRPHPAVWRAVLSVAVLYLMLVIFFNFQSLDTIRQLVGLYDASTFETLPERSYAEDCRMSTEDDPHKFYNTVMDEFIIAHALGYWGKMIVLRDWRVVTAVSIGFEIIEVTFQHILPNFRECWWDHVIVDVLICNAGGTFLGWLTLKAFGSKEYQWTRLADIHNVPGKAARVAGQFLPRAVATYEWHMFDSPKRFLQVAVVLAAMFMQEVNAFTIKYILNMEPRHHLVMLRLVMWGIIAIPGLREFYDYISDPKVFRLGTTAWVGAAALIFEFSWVAKAAYDGVYFRQAWPAHIALPWLLVLAMFAFWSVAFFGTPQRIRRGTRGAALAWRAFLGAVWYGMLVILLAMCVMGNDDVAWGREVFDRWALDRQLW